MILTLFSPTTALSFLLPFFHSLSILYFQFFIIVLTKIPSTISTLFYYCINISFADRFWPQEKEERSKNCNIFCPQKKRAKELELLNQKKKSKAHFNWLDVQICSLLHKFFDTNQNRKFIERNFSKICAFHKKIKKSKLN